MCDFTILSFFEYLFPTTLPYIATMVNVKSNAFFAVLMRKTSCANGRLIQEFSCVAHPVKGN